MPRIIIEAQVLNEAELEQVVDKDIATFSDYFQSLGNDPLSRFESSTIKTYLHWKTHGEPSSSTPSATTEGTNAT